MRGFRLQRGSVLRRPRAPAAGAAMPHHHAPSAGQRTRAMQRRRAGRAQAEVALARRHHPHRDVAAEVHAASGRAGAPASAAPDPIPWSAGAQRQADGAGGAGGAASDSRRVGAHCQPVRLRESRRFTRTTNRTTTRFQARRRARYGPAAAQRALGQAEKAQWTTPERARPCPAGAKTCGENRPFEKPVHQLVVFRNAVVGGDQRKQRRQAQANRRIDPVAVVLPTAAAARREAPQWTRRRRSFYPRPRPCA